MQPEQNEAVLGDYDSLLKYVREEMDSYEAQRPFHYKYKRLAIRFLIRLTRMIVGFLLLLVAIASLGQMIEMMDTPFAKLTPTNLVGIVALGFAVWFFGRWSWVAAFGAGPSKQSIEEERTESAEKKLREIYPQYKQNMRRTIAGENQIPSKPTH